MNSSTRYRVVRSGLTHQNIDGEVIVIHLVSGKYYSLTGAAAAIWEALAKPHSAMNLAGIFSDLPEDGRDAIEAILERLVGEKLVEACSDSADSVSTVLDSTVAWQHPVLEVYNDMQDLLLADPIHDVDDHGWPSLPPGPAA